MAGKRCAREGCRAWAMRGAATCRVHAVGTTGPRGVAGADDRVANEAGEERERRAHEFWSRLERGDYRDLLERTLAKLVEQAGREGALTEEIGTLRVVLKTLLNTDLKEHADELSVSIPRLVNAIVRALKAQRAISGQTAGDLTEALTRVLLEMGLGE
jgi:hypothetical protein